MSSITDFILGFSVTLLETLIFKATHKKLAYIYSSQEEAFLAFAAMAYSPMCDNATEKYYSINVRKS